MLYIHDAVGGGVRAEEVPRDGFLLNASGFTTFHQPIHIWTRHILFSNWRMSAMAPSGIIDQVNALSLTEFRHKFWPPDASKAVGATSVYKDVLLLLELQSSGTLPQETFDLCYDIIHSTSSEQYAASSLGWHPIKKQREMRLPDLKYITLMKTRNLSDHAQMLKEYFTGFVRPIDGFLSFMFTYEDGIDVIYCYELHLQERYQGKGLGKCLMRLMEDIGKKAGVKKAMLTVFRANEAARGFYKTLGYEEDAFSPRPKRLRGGVVKESDYIILSKTLVDDTRQTLEIENESLKDEVAKLREENAALKAADSRKRKAG